MPPHCDTIDGPVVVAAKKALESGNINLILPWVFEGGWEEVRDLFKEALGARKAGGKAQEVADLWFSENVVRIHRKGEGAGYTGLKPAGLDTGPIIPRIDKGMETGSIKEVVDYISHEVETAIHDRFNNAYSKKNYNPNNPKAGREFVEAYLGLTLFSHHLHMYIVSGGEHHGEESEEGVQTSENDSKEHEEHHH